MAGVMTKGEEIMITLAGGGAVTILIIWMMNKSSPAAVQAAGLQLPPYQPATPQYSPDVFTLADPGPTASVPSPGMSAVFNFNNPVNVSGPNLGGSGSPAEGSGGCNCPTLSTGNSSQSGSAIAQALQGANLINFMQRFLPSGVSSAGDPTGLGTGPFKTAQEITQEGISAWFNNNAAMLAAGQLLLGNSMPGTFG